MLISDSQKAASTPGLIARPASLLNLYNTRHFVRKVVRGPFESETFKIGSAKICQPIKRLNGKSLT